MAREMGVDLGSVPGTGPLGRVMKTDVLAYVEQQQAPAPELREQRARPRPQPRSPGGEERIPLRGLRKRIAESMVRSKSTAPHFTFVEETDTKSLTALRARLNQGLAARGESKLSYLPFIAKALVAAFRKYPHLNAVMDEAKQELVVKQDVNLGFGAATEQGLTVFVVKNVESLGLLEIGAEIDRLVRLDLVLYPGFSGGPLVDAAGRVVGLNTSGLARESRLALPVTTVARVTDELLRKGHVARAYLGIGMQPVRLPEPLRAALGLPGDGGLIVVMVEPDGPAARAGLLLGDVLVALDGAPTGDLEDVQAQLGAERIGTTVTALVVRAGARTEVRITVGERPRRGAS